MHIWLHGIHFSILACYGQIISDEHSDKLSLCLTDGIRCISSKVMLVPWSCLHLRYDSMSYLMVSEEVLDPGQTHGNGGS